MSLRYRVFASPSNCSWEVVRRLAIVDSSAQASACVLLIIVHTASSRTGARTATRAVGVATVADPAAAADRHPGTPRARGPIEDRRAGGDGR